MDGLVEWLRGVLADDEKAAKAATPGPWSARFQDTGAVVDPGVAFDREEGGVGWEDAVHIALHDPEQVLADVAAKRAILDAYLPEDGDPHPGLPCINYEGQNPEHYSEWDTCSRHIKANETLIRQDFVIRLLASAYRHRPGWKDEWE